MLKFGSQNTKLNNLARMLGMRKSEVLTFDLPAGYTCPAASLCQTYANRETGKLVKRGEFTCYAAKIEAVYPNSRHAHWHNFEHLRPIMHDTQVMADMLLTDLPQAARVVRIHSSGDFFTTQYFNAWLMVAESKPQVVFFGYTKMLPLLHRDKPSNLSLVYSYGGKYDTQWTPEIPTSFVAMNQQHADELGVPIACPTSTRPDDFHYILEGKSFSILLH